MKNLPNNLSIRSATAPRRHLMDLPAQRPEIVEAGKQLAASPDYPPFEVVRGIAKTLLRSRDLTEAG